MSANSLTLYKKGDRRIYILSYNGVKLGIKENIFGSKIKKLTGWTSKKKLRKTRSLIS
jgi:hypothetical protein